MRINILGPVEAIAGDRTLSPSRRQHRLLLGILALEANRVVPAERLIGLLWPGEAPKRARAVVHSRMSELRAALADLAPEHDAIVTRHDGYLLRCAATDVDAHRFTDLVARARTASDPHHRRDLLRTALGLWHGPLLGDLPHTETYGALSQPLESARLTAAEDLYEVELRLGDAATVAAEVVAALAGNDGRERLTGLAMRALYRCGRAAEAIQVYERCRRWLAAELGIDPGAELQELHLAILRADDALLRPAAPPVPAPPAGPSLSAFITAVRPGPARSAMLTPSQLPYDTREFTGRAAEIAYLLAGAGQDQRHHLPIYALTGMGGVGKTALVTHIAHRLAPHFPDGQYFLDLRGFTAGVKPVPPAQALDTLLRDSGVPADVIPADTEGKATLWRSRTAAERILLVLDNAADAAQVRPLLPGSPSATVLITSRRTFAALDGALPVPVDVLPHADAVRLFTRMVGADRAAAEPDAVNAVVAACGLLPLAIRIVAARLRHRANRRIADLVSQLTAPGERTTLMSADDRDVSAVIMLSYRALTPDLQRFFRVLSMHPGRDLDPTAAAAMTGLSLAEATRHLESLLEDSLLLQRAPGRYHLHDLVRDCTREALDQDPEEARREVLHRLFDFYLCAAHLWCHAHAVGPFRFAPEVRHKPDHLRIPDDDAEALRLSQAERHNFVAVAELARELNWSTHAWQLPCALQPFLKQLNYGEDAARLFTGAVDAARALGDRDAESLSLHGLALAQRQSEASDRAKATCWRAVELSRACGHPWREAYQLNDLAIMFLNDGALKEAHRYFAESRRIAAQEGDHELCGLLDINLGYVCAELGRFDEAALRLTGESTGPPQRPQAQMFALVNTGLLMHLRGDDHDAVRCFEQAVARSRELDFWPGEAEGNGGLCRGYRAVGRLDDALSAGEASLRQAREFRSHQTEADALNALGDVLVVLGRTGEAVQAYEAAHRLGTDLGMRTQVARSLNGLAHAFLATGAHAEARTHWERALLAYPDGHVEATSARAHLDALATATVTCCRCVSAARGG